MNTAWPMFIRRIFEPDERLQAPCRGPELWTIPLDDPMVHALGRSVLSPEEKVAAERFASASASARYASAHGALRLLLGRWMGLDPREVRYFRNACGKPFVKGGPHFNLSHADGLAAVAIAPDCEVGVDIERIKPFSGIEDIMEQYFSLDERMWIAGGCPPETRFFQCWVLRETFVKALGAGLSLSLERFRIRMPSVCGENVDAELLDGSEHDVMLAEWHPAAGFAGALAVRGGVVPPNENRAAETVIPSSRVYLDRRAFRPTRRRVHFHIACQAYHSPWRMV